MSFAPFSYTFIGRSSHLEVFCRTDFLKYFAELIIKHLSWSPFQQSSLHKKAKFSIKDFLSKCDQIHSFMQIWSHLLNKSCTENFIFCTVVAELVPAKNKGLPKKQGTISLVVKNADFISSWSFQAQKIAFKTMIRFELVIMKSLSQSM